MKWYENSDNFPMLCAVENYDYYVVIYCYLDKKLYDIKKDEITDRNAWWSPNSIIPIASISDIKTHYPEQFL